jgi:Xaa-Pro aminopeptidase
MEHTSESVGPEFKLDQLQAARDKTLEVILELASHLQAGVSEAGARKLLLEIQTKKGAPKSWHPAQIRFGENTLLSFGKTGAEEAVLKDGDIYFIDIGPIFDGHEGDVGRAFVVGHDPEKEKCCKDIEKIWHEVRDHWKNEKATGKALYEFAKKAAADKGWVLTLDGADGHRISDFPHAAKHRGSVIGLEHKPMENRWILEIQIHHPTKPFGAFYEDLLN